MVQKQFDSKFKRVDDELRKLKQDTAMQAEEYELDQEDALFKSKKKIQSQLQSEWDTQKREFERHETESKKDYQSILD